MQLRLINRYVPYYRQPAPSTTWTAALVGGAVGMLVMGAVWYIQARMKARPQTPSQLGWSRQGQAPARSHIRMSTHVANQHYAEPR